MKKLPLALLLAGAALMSSACLGPEDMVKSSSDSNDKDNDSYTTPVDCNDNDPLVNPGAKEICGNGKDDDCDGKTDAADSDCQSSGCIHPDDCDGDHYAGPQAGGPDCNDADATVHPGANEVCNGKDDNCNGQVDEGCTQSCSDCDKDGFIGPQAGGPDCNDADATVHPGANEVCNGKDDDCNGQADEGNVCGSGTGGTGGTGGSSGLATVDVRYDLPAGAVKPNNVILRGSNSAIMNSAWTDLCSLVSPAPDSFWGDGSGTYGCTLQFAHGSTFDFNIYVENPAPGNNTPSKTDEQFACYELLGGDAASANPPSGLTYIGGTAAQCKVRAECYRDYGKVRVNGQVVGVVSGAAVANGNQGPTAAGCNFRYIVN